MTNTVSVRWFETTHAPKLTMSYLFLIMKGDADNAHWLFLKSHLQRHSESVFIVKQIFPTEITLNFVPEVMVPEFSNILVRPGFVLSRYTH